MKSVSVVIGANYGDEGKGHTVDYLANQHISSGDSCLVVLCNGGPQRGHTVTLESKRHVFHHFGSGLYAGADTFITNHYIVNPIIFHEEYENLLKENTGIPKIYLNSSCRFTTPYDMILNQILESERGENRKGSCGFGIWETVCRYQFPGTPLIKDILTSSNEFLRDYLHSVRELYIENRLDSQGYPGVPPEWKSIVRSEDLITNYIEDFQFMLSKCIIVNNDKEVLEKYDHLIFEMGQGLMLEDTYAEDMENSTPSNTGLHNPTEILTQANINTPIQVYFITRSYLTRHGVGHLDNECNHQELGIWSTDKTNVPNEFQGVLRYAPLWDRQLEDMLERISLELSSYVRQDLEDTSNILVPNLVVTHVDEVQPDFIPHLYLHEPWNSFNSILISDGETRESIKVYQ
jgi:adenylosuccinate synthase